MLNVKQKHNGMDQNTIHCYGDYVTTNQQVYKKIKHADVILHPYRSHCFQRLVKTYYVLLDFLKACCQSVLR